MTRPSRTRRAGVGRLCLTLDVTYALNGQSIDHLKDFLDHGIRQAIGAGLLSGYTEAEVEEYSVDVAITREPPPEHAIARLMAHRIATGELLPDDLPVRLARYGLMQPNAFIAEMRERMQSR